jgi:DNA-binding CsgD family transcriptional regulator
MVEGGVRDALDGARGVRALARTGADPIVHTGFLCPYSYVLALIGQYNEALEAIDALSALAENSAIEFAARYAQMNRVKALVGLRKFTAAARALSTIERQIQSDSAAYSRENYPVNCARLYASVGNVSRALEFLSVSPEGRFTKAGRSEFLGWNALLNAAVGNPKRASSLAAQAREAGRSVESQGLALVAEAICALNAGRNEEAVAGLGLAIATEAVDPIVIAVRATPTLGAFIAEQPQWHSWFQRVLVASRDSSLARNLGVSVPREARGSTSLSPREEEVHELLAQGMTNEEIAKLLYISLSTTKVHVKHIYDKLGVHSRLEAARALRDGV